MKCNFRFMQVIVYPALFFSLLFNSQCKSPNKQSNNNELKSPESNLKMEELNDQDLKKRLLVGDTTAYFELRKQYVDRNKPTDFLPWALVMANKYKFETAYYDVFFCIQEINTYYGGYLPDKKSYTNYLDSTTIEFSKKYLYKMSDKEEIKSDLDFYSKTFSNPVVR
jgi:hypothetical protein